MGICGHSGRGDRHMKALQAGSPLGGHLGLDRWTALWVMEGT